MKKAIFLDRDGVLNKLISRSGKLQAPYTLSEFELFPGVVEALKLIKEKGYLAIYHFSANVLWVHDKHRVGYKQEYRFHIFQ